MKRLLLILIFLAQPLWAVQPDEILADPVLEQRAREISQGLRCPVCQNESIDESNAAISRDLRILLRERLVEGDTDGEAVDFLLARFGEFILLEPDRRGANLILWAAAPVLLLLALIVGWRTIRRKDAQPARPLTAEEQAEVDTILKT